MRYVRCNLCGADDFAVVFDAGVAQVNRVVRCNSCKLMYANPKMIQDEFAEVADYDLDVLVENKDKRFDKEELQVRDYLGTRAYLEQQLPGKGKLLEIGSGFGFLLNFFRSTGWEVLGIEPMKAGGEYAKRRFGVDTLPCIIENADLADGSFDVVLMMHVIEHMPDPLNTLEVVNRVLKPGGLLVIETPRYDTLMFRLLKHRERSVSCDGHIFFFTLKSLEDLAAKAGFSLIKQDCVGRSLTVDRLMWNVGVVSKSRRIAQSLEWLSRKLGLNRIWLHANTRDMQRIVVRKNPELGTASLPDPKPPLKPSTA